MQIEGTNCVCLSLILIDCFQDDKNYYPQAFLKECKNVVKVNKMTNFLDKEVEQDSSDNYSDESNTE